MRPPDCQAIINLYYSLSVDNFNIYPNTRLGKLVKAKKLDEILDLCDDFCPGEPPEYFFDRYDDY